MFRRLCFSRARLKAMAASFSSYEKQRQKNIEENRKVLQSLGLLNGGLFSKRRQAGIDPGIDGGRRKHGVKRKRSGNEREPNPGFKGCYTRRWSRRLEGKEPKDYGNLDFELEDADDDDRSIIKRQTRISENSFGSIPGIDVGTTWATRLDCSRDGVHRPTVAGIHGNECEGCYSIALSGGYEDDLDFGLAFTYTGAGGRDLKGTKANPKNLRTAPQSKDQTLARSNLALSRNVENRQPVRVIRGYKLGSPYAPEEGYRYDGLYTVERFWQAIGLSGFMVYKFALKRCENQTPYPWKLNVDDLINGDHENGVLPENELEEGNTENLEAREDGKYAVPLAEQKAGTESSDDKEDDLPEENPAEAKELTSNKNAEEETNGKPVTEKAVSDSVVKNSHEGNTAALQSKELQASTLPAQNDATQECNQNGAEADQEILKKEPGTNDGNSKRQNGQLNGKSTED